MSDKTPNEQLHRQENGGGRKRDWTWILLAILTVTVILVALAFSIWMFRQAPPTQYVRFGQTLEQAGVVLTQTQNILSLVALLLAMATALGSLFAVLLSRYVKERLDIFGGTLAEEVGEFNQQIISFHKDITDMHRDIATVEGSIKSSTESLQRSVDDQGRRLLEQVQAEQKRSYTFVRTSLVSISEIVQSTLPRVTLSQQIPADVVRTVEPIYNIMAHAADADGFEQWLDEQGNGTRIRYAQALFLLGREPMNGAPAHYEKAAQLLSKALDTARDRELSLDIQMRLFQTHRQLRNYEAAEACLAELRRGGERTKFLALWGVIVLNLQRGFDARGEERRAWFASAAHGATEVLDQVGWEGYARAYPALAYYCAKGLWAFLFSRASRQEVAEINNFKEAFSKAVRLALETLNRSRDRRGGDEIIEAIYLASRAYVEIACRTAGDEDLDRGLQRTSVENGSAITGMIDDSVRLIRDSRIEGFALYDDHHECLGASHLFGEYLETLRGFVENPGSVEDFYVKGYVSN